MVRYILLILGFLLVGCTSEDIASHPEPIVQCPVESVYDVRVDPALSPAWKEAIRRGTETWIKVLGGSFQATVREAKPTRADATNPCAISWLGGATAKRWGEMNGKADSDRIPDWSVVWVRDDVGENGDGVEYATVLHELGHILGLDHNDDREANSVMWPFITVPGRLSCTDVENACKIWGCTPVACEKGEYVR